MSPYRSVSSMREPAATASASPSLEARWISPAASQVNRWTRFHRSLEVGEVPAKAAAFIAADTKYWLWVNGRLALQEGGLKRALAHGAIDRGGVDLAQWLKPGRNSLAVLVWHFGQDGFSHDCSGSSGRHFSMDLPGGPVARDGAWRTSNEGRHYRDPAGIDENSRKSSGPTGRLHPPECAAVTMRMGNPCSNAIWRRKRPKKHAGNLSNLETLKQIPFMKSKCVSRCGAGGERMVR